MSWLEPDGEGYRLGIARFDGSAWERTGSLNAGGSWFVNWADVPSVEPSGPGRLWAHWLEMLSGEQYAYGVRIARSDDQGATWTTPEWLHDDRSATEHGFAALVGDGHGGVTAVWLDGGKYATGENEMVVKARDIDPAGVFGPESIVDDRTCDCCPNAAVRLADGRVVAAYRDRSVDEVRDIGVAVRTGGNQGLWSEPRRLHEDAWTIDSCPVNGPALDADGDRVVAAWFTMEGSQPRVFASFSGDGGASFGPPIRIDEGAGMGRVDVEMLSDGSAIVIWIEAGGSGAEAGGSASVDDPATSAPIRRAGIMARRVMPDQGASEARLLVETATSRAAGYPRLVRSGDTLLLAWTEASDQRNVKVARVRHFQ